MLQLSLEFGSVNHFELEEPRDVLNYLKISDIARLAYDTEWVPVRFTDRQNPFHDKHHARNRLPVIYNNLIWLVSSSVEV